GGYDARFAVAQDYDLWMRLAAVTRLANLPDALVVRRLLPGRVSVARDADRLRAEARARWRAVRAGAYPPWCLVFVARPLLALARLRPGTLLALRRLVSERGVSLIHSHGKGAGLYGRLVARLLGVPAVHTLHGLHFEGYGAAARAAYLALERRLSRWTRVVVNVSRAQEAEGLALRLFDRRQSRVVVNGVDVAHLGATALERWDARPAVGLPPSGPVVGCAARFDPVKRLDLLLRAAARVTGPPPRVVPIGRG